MGVRLLHVSDVHFGPPHRAEIDDIIRKFVEDYRPHALLVSGDITQRAHEEQFRQAQAYFDSLSVPQVIVPGNHDVPLWALHERFTRPFARYRSHFRDELEPSLKLEGAWIFGMNTAKAFTAKNGIFREDSLKRCEAFFAEAPAGALRIVVAHHHLLPAPGLLYDPVASRAREAAYSFARAKVDVVVAGHLHHAFIATTRDFYPKLPYLTRIVHSGTSMSNRGRNAEYEANSLNTIEADDMHLVIENLRFAEGQHEFTPSARYTYPRKPAGLPL